MSWLAVDREITLPLNLQLYEKIRAAILSGELKAGDLLPPTRELAAEINVSRNVVVVAYDQLCAEGFVVGRQGSGTYVADGLWLAPGRTPRPQIPIVDAPIRCNAAHIIDFRTGMPAGQLFPRKAWHRIAQHVLASVPHHMFGYGDIQGELQLREAISRRLRITRGICCHAAQILITNGSAQAFSLLAHVFMRRGAIAVLEDPTTAELHDMFTAYGGKVHAVPVDANGLITDTLPTEIQPRFVFVTPSHQFPLGGILSARRRIKLISYANTYGCYIVEDDYDSEFRYDGPPLSPLHSLAPERVIYVGSFSKILSPALRIGYMVLPWDLVEKFRFAKKLHDIHTTSLNQIVLAAFIDQGYLEQHLRKTRKVYKDRRNFLVDCLQRAVLKRGELEGISTGLHLVVRFPGMQFHDHILQNFAARGVQLHTVDKYTLRPGSHLDRLIFGYGHLTKEEIAKGIEIFNQGLQ